MFSVNQLKKTQLYSVIVHVILCGMVNRHFGGFVVAEYISIYSQNSINESMELPLININFNKLNINLE